MSLKIAFHGKMGSGKDTAVDYCIKNYGGYKITFAEPLYKILKYAQEVCGFKKEKDRKFLQFIGTEWAREKDEDVWINLAINKSREINGNIFNNDCRFMNEFEALKKEGFICIKIIRDESLTTKRIGNGISNHSSEYGLPDEIFDYIINNNDTIEKFYQNLDLIINKLQKPINKKYSKVWRC